MHTQRVEVLHVAHRDAIVAAVANDLVLDLLPAAQVLVDEHLLRDREGLGALLAQLLFCIGEPRTQPAQGKGCSHEHWKADFLGGRDRVLDVRGRLGHRQSLVDVVQLLRKDLSVLRGDDGLDGRAEHLAVVFLEHSGAPQLDADVERRLSTHADDDAVGPFLGDDLLHY